MTQRTPWGEWRGTTVIGIRHNNQVAVAGDGQVTLGSTVMKSGARKVRRLYHDQILCGFAGATGDAFTLFDRLEAKLQEHRGNLLRAAVELSKDWRTDKYLRRLEALLVAANRDSLLILSGNGDVVEPDDGIAAIGSGGPYALAAARALKCHTNQDAPSIAREALRIAADICIYTNSQIVVEVL